MVVSLDIGNPYDVHPQNKQEFGRRLALQALKIAYNQPITADGPEIESYQVKNDTIIIRTKATSGKLRAVNPSNLTGFELLRADGVVTSAKALLKNDHIMVLSFNNAFPVEVRYSWTNNPQCSLFNEAGLPMAPFRLLLK
jgi:sialate O-acetylesterase